MVITRVLGALPHSLDPQVVAEAEHSLATHATQLRPTELATAGERLLAHLDPDGHLSDDTDQARRRGLVIGAQGGDGMSPIHGLLDPTTRALLDAALGALARPSTPGRPVNSDSGAHSTAGAGVPDPRSPSQRRHDALGALCRTLLATSTLPSNRGLPATVILTMSITQLQAALANTTPSARPGSGPVPNPDGTYTIAPGMKNLDEVSGLYRRFTSGSVSVYEVAPSFLAPAVQVTQH